MDKYIDYWEPWNEKKKLEFNKKLKENTNKIEYVLPTDTWCLQFTAECELHSLYIILSIVYGAIPFLRIF